MVKSLIWRTSKELPSKLAIYASISDQALHKYSWFIGKNYCLKSFLPDQTTFVIFASMCGRRSFSKFWLQNNFLQDFAH